MKSRGASSFFAMMKRPGAFVPPAMSAAAFATVVLALAIHGSAGIRQPDEGAAAHIWQLLMAGQLPIVVWTAIQSLPRAPRQTLQVLAVQAVAGFIALAPVFLLHL